MALPTLSGVARLVADPELRFTPSGAAVASVRLAFNSRRKNDQTGEWEDADVFWIRGTAWRQLAENVTETLAKGMEVVVTGELRTESWEKDGQKHSAPALNIRSIGPNLAYATAAVHKAASDGSSGRGPSQTPQQSQQRSRGAQRGTQPPADDPWATTPSDWGKNQPPF